MLIPPLPPNEAERLALLKDCEILDTDPEAFFDQLTALAAHICQAPISLISLVDAQRQWFKSRYGLTLNETPRHVAFCAHAILETGPFIVPDALQDERFADNPMVTGEPHIRFYAGAPLVMPTGQVLGTLCVFDSVPRELHLDHRRALLVLCQHVISQLELRLKTNELRRTHAKVLSLNRSLEKRTGELERTNAALQSFSHSVAHDLRAPLRSISGAAGVLCEDHAAELSAPAQKHLAQISQRAREMSQMIDALLGLARLNRHELTMTDVDIPALLREILAELKDDIAARRIDVRLGDCPSCHGDRSLLRQMFMNLLANAVKYTGHCAAPRIEIAGLLTPTGIRYTITDNGAGFDEKYRDRLFNPFQRLHRDEEFSGLGIGLAMVKRILDHHGGSISATAAVGRGATFTVELPVAPAAND